MPPVDDYARAREARRTGALLTYAGFVLVFLLATSLRVGPLAEVIILVAGVALVLFAVITLVRRKSPAALTALAQRPSDEAWPANAPVSAFPDVLARNPRMRATTEITGTVSLGPSGVNWHPSERSARSFGAVAAEWDTTWTPWARRLSGFGGQVQLTLDNPDSGHPVTLWLRRAGTMHIP